MKISEARTYFSALTERVEFSRLVDAYVEYRMAMKRDDFIRTRDRAYKEAARALGSFAPDIRKRLENMARSGAKELGDAKRHVAQTEKRVVALEGQVPDHESKAAHKASLAIASRMWKQQRS